MFLLCINDIYSQFSTFDKGAYYINSNENPVFVDIKVDKYGSSITLDAINKTFYPYQLEIKFEYLNNLTPLITSKSFILNSGKTHLLILRRFDNTKGFNFNATYKFFMGIPTKSFDREFPYLIPVKERRELIPVDLCEQLFNTKDGFNLIVGDSVFCMRKGLVVGVPGMSPNIQRISDNTSLEILHKDGTIMVYKNISSEVLMVELGKTVYPSQPLGLIDDKNTVLALKLIINEGESKFKNANIKFCTDKENVESLSLVNEKPIKYPFEIIIKEMSKREQKKLKKNSLF